MYSTLTCSATSLKKLSKWPIFDELISRLTGRRSACGPQVILDSSLILPACSTDISVFMSYS